MLGGLGGFYAVQQDIKREEACSNNICLKNLRSELYRGKDEDTQEDR